MQLRSYHAAVNDTIHLADCEEIIKNARLVRAAALNREGKLRASEEELTAGIAAFPDDPAMLYLRGNIRGNVGNWSGSLSDFDRLVAMQPSEPMPHYFCAVALRNMLSKEGPDQLQGHEANSLERPGRNKQIMQASIAAYERFLELASPEGRKVCEAWWNLSLLQMLMLEDTEPTLLPERMKMISKLAERGFHAEAHMLPV